MHTRDWLARYTSCLAITCNKLDARDTLLKQHFCLNIVVSLLKENGRVFLSVDFFQSDPMVQSRRRTVITTHHTKWKDALQRSNSIHMRGLVHCFQKNSCTEVAMFTATSNLSQELLSCRDRIHAHANTGVNLFNSGDEDTCTETEINT